jgi:hypothetical protein
VPDSPSTRVLPHLTPEEISDRDHQESRLHRELTKCWQGDEFDGERAFHVLRAHSVEIFKVVYPAYKKKRGFEPEWIPDIVQDTLYRTLKVYAAHNAHGMPSLAELAKAIEGALSDYLEDLKSTNSQAAPEPPVALSGKQAAAYARAGIDMASASPLLLMAHAAAQESARRVGTAPPLTAPKRRIPRSIHSESAAKKLEDYLNAKGVSQTQFAIRINVDPKTLYRFRTTGNVGKPVAQAIAQAMGITLEEFISR